MYGYFDNSATTAPCDAAIAAVSHAIGELFGNPSSLHSAGTAAFRALEEARSSVASLLGCESSHLYFSPSGTAANNTAIFGTFERLKKEGNTIVTTAAEHPSVAKAVKRLEENGVRVVRVSPDKQGRINEDELLSAIDKNTVLVSVMAVNNETGAVFPVKGIKSALKRAGAPGLVHCDCVQAFGKLKVTPKTLNADIITVSAHKIHGIKGAGAMYVSQKNMIKPRLLGGGQESGMFSGTEAVPALLAFGAAAREVRLNEDYSHAELLRSSFLSSIASCECITVNSPEDAVPYIVNISMGGVMSQPAVSALDSKGFCVSAGSACTKGGRSGTLTAMGLDSSIIDSAVRISFSRYNTVEEAEALGAAIKEVIKERSK